MSAPRLVAVVALAQLCACAQPGVQLTIVADPQLADAAVASIRTLDLAVRGDEELDRAIALGRAFSPSREERLLYEPQPHSRSLHLMVGALDGSGALVAVGQTDVMPRAGQAVSARLVLTPLGAVPSGDGDGGSSAGDAGASAADLATSAQDLAARDGAVSGGDGGTVTLPANAGDTCKDAPELPIGVDVPNQSTTPLHDDYSAEWKVNAACNQTSLSYSPGRDGVYRLTVPAGKTLMVTLTTGTGDCYHWPFEPDLFLFTDCANVGGSCLFCALATDISHTVLQYQNGTGAPLPLYLAVDQAYSFGDGYGCYSLRADVK